MIDTVIPYCLIDVVFCLLRQESVVQRKSADMQSVLPDQLMQDKFAVLSSGDPQGGIVPVLAAHRIDPFLKQLVKRGFVFQFFSYFIIVSAKVAYTGGIKCDSSNCFIVQASSTSHSVSSFTNTAYRFS